MKTYEQRLDDDLDWALREGSAHFAEADDVFKALNRVTERLDRIGVDYVIAGAMAFFLHGYRRFTEDVDLLVTRDGLKKLHEELEGLGYVPPFSGSKTLRDTELGVRIDFMISGDYPGDGKPKPVVFPKPDEAVQLIRGRKCLPLAKLIELKLASGMSNLLRGKDITDVVEAVKVLRPPRDLADKMDPSVRDKFLEIWTLVDSNPPEDY